MAALARLRRLLRARRDRGASAIEFVLLTPILVFVLFAVVQFAMFFFARQVVGSAAQAGARIARAEADHTGAWRGDAINRAQKQISGLGSQMVVNPQVETVQNGGSVGVRVTAAPVRILPFLPTIDVTSEGPIERFTADTQ